MSFIPAQLDPLLHIQASPSVLAISFSVLLVVSLLAAEEMELRRGRASSGTAER